MEDTVHKAGNCDLGVGNEIKDRYFMCVFSLYRMVTQICVVHECENPTKKKKRCFFSRIPLQ
jgi:hypothetical protein